MNLLQVGTKVDIVGQLRSYNNYNSKKNRLVLTIFAREISLPEEEEGKNINQVYLNGFICKPPIYRKTPFGREISDILVAVNRAIINRIIFPALHGAEMPDISQIWRWVPISISGAECKAESIRNALARR